MRGAEALACGGGAAQHSRMSWPALDSAKQQRCLWSSPIARISSLGAGLGSSREHLLLAVCINANEGGESQTAACSSPKCVVRTYVAAWSEGPSSDSFRDHRSC